MEPPLTVCLEVVSLFSILRAFLYQFSSKPPAKLELFSIQKSQNAMNEKHSFFTRF